MKSAAIVSEMRLLWGAQATSLLCPAACRTQHLPEFPSHDTNIGTSRISNVLGQNTRLRLEQEIVAPSQNGRETLYLNQFVAGMAGVTSSLAPA